MFLCGVVHGENGSNKQNSESPAEAEQLGSDTLLLREFALHTYRHIAYDLLNGRGEYLVTLQSMLACNGQPASTEILRELLLASADAVDFSRRVSAAKTALQIKCRH
jgi:hypothetical protein